MASKNKKEVLDEVGSALGEHVAEKLEKRGWSKGAVRLVLLVGGALFASACAWMLGACGYAVTVERDGGRIVIVPGQVERSSK